MAIPEYKNGHFEEMAAWSQILQIVGNSTLIYLSFDTHDSPGAVFIKKWEKFSPTVPVCRAWEVGKLICGFLIQLDLTW